MKGYEIAVIMITWFSTLATCIIGGRYLYELHEQMDQGVYIQWDYHHSNQHFAITWLLMIISIWMFLHLFNITGTSNWIITTIVYNLACIFVVIPHLRNEK